MYLLRGQPVVYYGDEQGLAGAGGDQDARQDLFASRTAQYNDEDVVVGSKGSRDRYDTCSPLYRAIGQVAALRKAHPALADGAQVHRYASPSAGVFAVSRIDREGKVEYIVAANNATTARTVGIATFGDRAAFEPLLGSSTTLSTDAEGHTEITVPPLSVAVWKATRPIDPRRAAPPASFTSPRPGEVVRDRAEIAVSVPESVFAEVTFAFRRAGTRSWTTLGTDDNAPYRVFHDVRAIENGTLLEYRAVLRDSSGNVSATSTYGVVGQPQTARR